MTNPTPQGGEPMWSDQRIKEHLATWDNRGTPSKAHTAFAVLMDMRDEYEAKLAQQAARLLELERERDDLAARVNDGEAIEMLRWIVDAYHPQWHYEMGKTGYECAFCKSMFKTSKEFQDTASHKLGCQWAQSKVWLEAVKETKQNE